MAAAGENRDLVCCHLHNRGDLRVGQSDLPGQARDPMSDGDAHAARRITTSRPDHSASRQALEDHLLRADSSRRPPLSAITAAGAFEASSQTARSGSSPAAPRSQRARIDPSFAVESELAR